MSVTIVPTVVSAGVAGAQSVASSAATIQNILAGLVPSVAGLDAVTVLAKDIGGFEFDYMGEEKLSAGTDSTDHYTEANVFIQDHVAVKPTIFIARGFVSEVKLNKSSLLPELTALSTALAPVTPYLGTYSPGAAAAMANIATQTDAIINQIAAIQNLVGSISKVASTLAGTFVTAQQIAYQTLDALRTGGVAFAVVTPWATFGDNLGDPHGLMIIDNVELTQPEDTDGWTDVVVRLKEIRVAPSLLSTGAQDNARGSQAPTYNGSVSAAG